VRPALAYRHVPGPLGDGGALAASAYCAALAAAGLFGSDPIVLAGTASAVVVAGILARAQRALWVALRWGAALGLVLIVVNGLTSQRGDTVLVHGIVLPLLGHVDISAEALAEGGVLAARLTIVMMAFAVHAAAVDPDRVMRLLRPVAARSALTATLIARMVPLATRDYARLVEAAALRGPVAAPAGRAVIARRLVAGSLDRAIDVAATLELRGYGSGAPRSAEPARRSRHDAALWSGALAVAGVSIATQITGLGSFDAYPRIVLDAGPATVAAAMVLPLAATIPFAAAKIQEARRG
jgi:energy-coupling factor transport system permease protein